MPFGCGPPAHYVQPVQVAAYAREAGFRGVQVPIAVGIAFTESRFDTNAKSCTSSAAGLWQVLGGSLDPRENARQAFEKYRTQGWAGAWLRWESGSPTVAERRTQGQRLLAGSRPHGVRSAPGVNPTPAPTATGGCSWRCHAPRLVGGWTDATKAANCGGCGALGSGTGPGKAIFSTADFLGKLPRYLEVAAGGAVMAVGLGVLLVAVTGQQNRVAGAAFGAAKGGPAGAAVGAATAPRAPARPDVAADRERARTARLSAAESLAVRRAQEARRARAEAKLTESYVPSKRRVGGATVQGPSRRNPVASRPVRSVAR